MIHALTELASVPATTACGRTIQRPTYVRSPPRHRYTQNAKMSETVLTIAQNRDRALGFTGDSDVS